MFFDDSHVKLHGCFVVWNGITQPDKNQDGSPKYSLKVVVPPHCPDLNDFNQISQKALMESKFKGQLPAGGRMPMGVAEAHEFNGMYTGWTVLNCNTLRLPDVYDEQGNLLDPMQYGQLIYGGQQVDILVHCYEYDKAGNRGIATGLDAFAIIASANAPRQNFGGGGISTAGAFGGGTQQGQNMPQQQQQGFNPQQQQQQGFNPQQQGQNMPQQQQQQQQGFNPQQQGQNMQQQQQGGYPNQATNFLPNQQ